MSSLAQKLPMTLICPDCADEYTDPQLIHWPTTFFWCPECYNYYDNGEVI